MARLVRRRDTAPCPLILFVLLFLIAAVLAVLFRVQDRDKARLLTQRDAEKAELQARLDEVAGSRLRPHRAGERRSYEVSHPGSG